MRVYLAGPEVFLPDAVEVGRRKVEICADHGLVGVFPLDLDGPAGPTIAKAIFEACVAAMRSADAVVANLTPFRGLAADPGTAFELGYMVALGRPVFGYTNEPAPLRERVGAQLGPVKADGEFLFASDALAVEDFGLFENLMLAQALLADDGRGVFAPTAPVADPARDLTLFERCVICAAETLRPARPG